MYDEKTSGPPHEVFLQKIVSLHDKREYDKVKLLLIGSRELSVDEDYISRRVWIDEYTERLLDIIYYSCKTEYMKNVFNDSILKGWIFYMNNEMNKFYYRPKKEYDKQIYLNFKVQRQLWSDFKNKCSFLKVNINVAFKDAFMLYIEERVKYVTSVS